MATTLTAEQFADDTLIKKALAGDAESFTHLVNRHIGSVRKCIRYRVRNASDADDLVQNVLLKVWRCLSTFRSESTFHTWITRIAINETLMFYRRQQSLPYHLPIEDAHFIASPGELTDEVLIRAEVARKIRHAVRRLPPMYSSVLTLHDVNQLSVRETAQRLQATVSATKSRLFRGRGKLSVAIQAAGARPLVSAA